MSQATTFKTIVPANRMIQLPDDAPTGPVRIVVLVEDAAPATSVPGTARVGEGSWGPAVQIGEDFDAPLPPELQRYFEEDGGPEDTSG